MELVLDAFEAALGPTGPNPLHHRIEHAIQVTDEQLARLVAMDIAIVIHLDGATDWLLDDRVRGRVRPRQPGRAARAGSTAGATSWTPGCTSPRRPMRRGPSRTSEADLDAMGRPVDHIAAGMDGRVRTSPEMPAWAARPAADRRAGRCGP